MNMVNYTTLKMTIGVTINNTNPRINANTPRTNKVGGANINIRIGKVIIATIVSANGNSKLNGPKINPTSCEWPILFTLSSCINE